MIDMSYGRGQLGYADDDDMDASLLLLDRHHRQPGDAAEGTSGSRGGGLSNDVRVQMRC